MAVQLSTFHTKPDTTQTVTLAGVQYRLRLYWRERLHGWYMDLRELDETAVVLGRRLSADWGPLAYLNPANEPNGVLVVLGADNYDQDELGSDLLLLFYGTDELPEAAAPTTALTVAVAVS